MMTNSLKHRTSLLHAIYLVIEMRHRMSLFRSTNKQRNEITKTLKTEQLPKKTDGESNSNVGIVTNSLS